MRKASLEKFYLASCSKFLYIRICLTITFDEAVLLKAIDLKVNSQHLSCVSNKLFNVCFHGEIQRNQPTENLVHPWLEGARFIYLNYH